jgi:hypothetical protein
VAPRQAVATRRPQPDEEPQSPEPLTCVSLLPLLIPPCIRGANGVPGPSLVSADQPQRRAERGVMKRCREQVMSASIGAGPIRIAVVIAVLALSELTAVGTGSGASARHRIVPCSESVDQTRFPYIGSNVPKDRYRLVLGVVSVPPAFHKQLVRNGTEPWPYFFKAGLIIRNTGESVVVTVPMAWRDRAAIAWGSGGKGVFSSLRFTGCKALSNRGFAYTGGFYLRSAGCLPLTFRVEHRSATVRFGLGRRCL